ncbi:hypothetical protein [Paenibacillus cymbidii]|uniref:hypothetical protein n=1 Tax=Paenibacillus cymbidii TaxID=1639034 RepID=UPI0014368958|nr:hypothetical protein [Paenibacillus cymbidii]
MSDTSVSRIRYGYDEPLPERVTLRAGRLTLCLENGALRYIQAGEYELIRSIYVAVRDRNWSTIVPKLSDIHIEDKGDGFEINFTAEHRMDEIEFVWKGGIVGNPDSSIRFGMNGRAEHSFWYNRIGFCVLHPAGQAGLPLEVETESGIIEGKFPCFISPNNPFSDMKAMRLTLPNGSQTEIKFEGELFEMEDQRNWTDASFKTFCTPLRIPYPVEMCAGQIVEQAIELRLTQRSQAQAVEQGAAEPDFSQPAVTVGSLESGRLPQLGTTLPHPFRFLATPDQVWGRLDALRLSYLRAIVSLTSPDWRDVLVEINLAAKRLGMGLEIELLADEGGWEIRSFVDEIVKAEIPIVRVLVFPATSYESTRELLQAVARARDAAQLRFAIGGGTRVNFAEFNRMELPLDCMDVAAYTISPQVHTFDLASITETLTAQRATVESARQLTAGKPLSVGPVLWKQRLNPYATNEADKRRLENSDHQVDARQYSLFGAGWTLGSLTQLTTAETDYASYYQISGPLGIMEQDGRHVYPLYHILEKISSFATGSLIEILSVTGWDPLHTAFLAMGSGMNRRVLAANLTNETREIRVILGNAQPYLLWELNEENIDAAGAVRILNRNEASLHVEGEGSGIILKLLPFAVACIDASIKDVQK